jgi:serine/threonine-protein kinase
LVILALPGYTQANSKYIAIFGGVSAVPEFLWGTLGPYQIQGKVGKGGMATVYRAYHPGLDRVVAIKVMLEEFANDPGFLARFDREAKIVARLQHPHILPIFDYGEQDGIPYLVMPYITGGTLKDIIVHKTLSLDEITHLFLQIADALDYAHQQGILHRDIKPSNILIDAHGNALLSDFGLTRLAEHASSLTGTSVVGTPAYMSPEQGRGLPLDARSDLYS